MIATGTPPGVGPLQKGDAVEVAIEGIGVLRNLAGKYLSSQTAAAHPRSKLKVYSF